MIPSDVPYLKTLPPRTLQALQEAINACSARMGMPPDWVQRWLAFTLVADALTERLVEGRSPFELKGGAAMELRLRQQAAGPTPRASKDLDATFRGPMDEIEMQVRANLGSERQGFTFRVINDGETPRHMRRFEVAVSYRGRAFSRVKLEISAYEGQLRDPDHVPAPSLVGFGLAGPGSFPCLPLSKQVAQKLHAVTEPTAPGKVNDRFRDLVDLVMLSSLAPPSSALREICEETFQVRQKHGWPPAVVAQDRWAEPLARLARELGLSVVEAADIANHVAGYVAAIAAA